MFRVEDGTGLADATSYVSVPTADDYFADSGTADWLDSDLIDKEAALVKATRALDRMFASRLEGYRASSGQALCFPRRGIFDDLGAEVVGVPVAVKHATYELALQSMTAPLFQTAIRPDAEVIEDTTEIGPITITKKFAPSKTPPGQPPSRQVYLLMRPFVTVTGKLTRV